MNENTHPLSLYFQLRNIQYGKERKDTERLNDRRGEVSTRKKLEGHYLSALRYKVEHMQKYLDALLSTEDGNSDLAFLAIRGFNLTLQETIIAAEQEAVALIEEWNTSAEPKDWVNKSLNNIGNELLSLFDIEQKKDKFISSRRN